MLRVAWTGIQTIAVRATCIACHNSSTPATTATAAAAAAAAFSTPWTSGSAQLRSFSALSRIISPFTQSKEHEGQAVSRLPASATGPTGPSVTSARTLTKFSLTKGKRKTVKAVVDRFMRLDWGVWIRPRVGRHKTLWRKSESNRRRLRQHVFCNGQQSHLFDKMVTRYWRRPRFYADDCYQPYHTREEFALTRKRPRPFP